MTDRDHDPIPLDTANNDGRSAGDGPAMARHQPDNHDERTTMTDDERRCFVAGHADGSEAQVNTHDGLIPVLTRLLFVTRAWVSDVEDDDEQAAAIAEVHAIEAQIEAVWRDVRRVRDQGHIVALKAFEIEWQMAVQR